MAGVSGGLSLASGVMGAVGGMKGGGGGGGTPKWLRKAGKETYKYGKQVADGMTVAPRNADQLAVDQGVRDAQGYLDPDMAGSQARAELLANGVTHEDIRGFYNPFEDDVVGSYLDDVNQMQRRRDLDVNDAAESARAFGGDREAVYRAVSSGEIDRNARLGLGSIRSRGYELASGNAMQNHSLKLEGNDQLKALIQQRRANRYSDLGALDASGANQQSFDQYERDLDQRRLDVRLAAMGTPQQAPAARTGGGFAGGLAGFQDAYQQGKDLFGLWGSTSGSRAT